MHVVVSVVVVVFVLFVVFVIVECTRARRRAAAGSWRQPCLTRDRSSCRRATAHALIVRDIIGRSSTRTIVYLGLGSRGGALFRRGGGGEAG